MFGNFTFHNPTKLYFGERSLENLSKELDKYGEKVMLVYGGGSSQLEGMADACPINESGYVVLTRKDVIEVLRQSL